MIELIEDNSLLYEKEILKSYSTAYTLIYDDELIGLGAIGEDISENMIFIVLKSEYRGNGLGRTFFEKLLYKKREQFESDKQANQDIFLNIEKNNLPMIRIVKKLNGIEVSETEDTLKFVI